MEKAGAKSSLDQSETKSGQPTSSPPPPEKVKVVEGSQLPQEPSTSSVSAASSAKKPQKARCVATNRPKLPSLHESCREAEDAGNGSSSGHKNRETRPCPQCLAEPEDSTEESKTSHKSFFGVRSYLHQFYESRGESTPGGGEEDFHYLIRPKGRTIGGVLFKIGLISGATLFLLGAVAIIVGYAIPTQEEIRGETDEFKIMDRNAMRFNRNLDMSKLAGLAMFCSGGLILVISLLAPTFTSSYWEEDFVPEGFRVPVNLSPIPEDEPRSPIPATEKIQGIQPIWTRSE